MNLRGGAILRRRIGQAGMTVIEVVMALLVSAVAVAGIVSGYTLTVTATERSAYALAADALALQRLEQARAAQWDADPSVPDQLVASNFPPQVAVLDLPQTGSAIVYATNFTSIAVVSASPPLKLVRVDCVWRFLDRDLSTNSLMSYRRPD